MNVPQVFCLVYGRLGIQEFLVVYTVVHKCIDGEIPYAERCQVLEEMGSLTGVYTVIRQSGFHNDAGALMCGHFTGMPSQVSLLPQRPGPTRT